MSDNAVFRQGDDVVIRLYIQFKVAKGLVHVEKGFQGRHKQIRIEDPKQIPETIANLMQ